MTESRTQAVLVSIAFFGILSLLPKMLAIAKDMAVATQFGVAQALDVYLMAFVLIGVPVSIIIVAMQTVLIPALVNKDNNAVADLLGGTIKLAVALLVFALPVWLLLLPVALEVLYPGNAEDVRYELQIACLWLIPYYFINGINLLLYGALQARKLFWPNAVLPGLFPLSILIAVWLMSTADIHSLLLGTVAGSALEGAALYFVLRYERLLRLCHTVNSDLIPLVRLALPLMAGGVITSFAPVVEQLIAFRLGPGAVSILSYGNKVPAALSSLLLTAIGIVVLPHFADLLAKREWHSCKNLYLRVSGIVLLVGILVSGIIIPFSESIVRLLFERGAFTAADTKQTAAVMSVYLLQFSFVLATMVSMRALVAMGKTLIMAWITTGQLILASGLAYIFSSQYGVVGVVFGTAVATIIGTVIFGAVTWHQLKEQPKDLAT